MWKLLSAATHFHSVWAVATFLLIVGRLISLRGVEAGTVLLFVVPPGLALVAATRSGDPTNRLLGNVFLTGIVLGQIIAPFPALFPKLGGVERNLGQVVDRTLTWYVGVYLIFVAVIVPARWAAGQLHRQWQGRPAQISAAVSLVVLVVATTVGLLVTLLTCRFLGFAPLA